MKTTNKKFCEINSSKIKQCSSCPNFNCDKHERIKSYIYGLKVKYPKSIIKII